MTTPLAPDLEAAIAQGCAQRDRADMGPAIAWFEHLLAQHPGHPVLTFEVAGAYDTAGREAEARFRYEEALRLGLSGETLRRCLCSTAARCGGSASSTSRWRCWTARRRSSRVRSRSARSAR